MDGTKEIDLRNRLRFAAGALAADFGEKVTADHAEALVFSSADILLADASVTEFVPILAERRARLALRSSARSATAPPAAPRAPTPPVAPPPTPPVPAPPAVAPLVSVPESQLADLRQTLEQVRIRVTDWRAEQDRR